MAPFARRRAVAALLIAAMVVGIGATKALAQEYDDSAAASIAGTTGADTGDVLTLAPGVTISDGDVSNATGIGVVTSGGTSAGAAPGGGSDAAVVE